MLVNRRGATADYDGFPGVHWATSLAQAGSPPDVVILSVRPESFAVLECAAPDAFILSFMAGISLDALAQKTGSGRIVRAMPNAACAIGKSFTPWVAAAGLSEADRILVRSILRSFGAEDEVPQEDQLEFLTGLSGAGPAFPALLAAALQAAAETRGVARAVAERAARSVIVDAPQLFLAEGGKTISDTLDAYMRYDGIVAQALRTTAAEGFDHAVKSGLDAAMQSCLALRRAHSGQK